MYKTKFITSLAILGAFATQVFADDLYQRKTITNLTTKEVIVMKCLDNPCGKIQFFAGQNEASLESISDVFDIAALKINGPVKEKLQLESITVENYEFFREDLFPRMYERGNYTPDVLYAGQVAGVSIMMPFMAAVGVAHGVFFDVLTFPFSVIGHTVGNINNSLAAKKMLKKYDFFLASDGNMVMKTGQWKRMYNYIGRKYRVK